MTRYWFRFCAAALLAVVVVDCGRVNAQVSFHRGVNPFTGRMYSHAHTFNPFTGRHGMTASTVNPWTGTVSRRAQTFNPWTGRTTTAVQKVNPWTGRHGNFIWTQRGW